MKMSHRHPINRVHQQGHKLMLGFRTFQLHTRLYFNCYKSNIQSKNSTRIGIILLNCEVYNKE